MAFVSNYSSQHVANVEIKVDGKNVRVIADGFWLTVSREEAAQFAADLLNAVEATPVDGEASA